VRLFLIFNTKYVAEGEKQPRRTGGFSFAISCPDHGRIGRGHFNRFGKFLWQAQFLMMLERDFLWQAQHLVMLQRHFSWQVQYLVMLQCHFSWQAQYLVMLQWQAQYTEKF